MSKITIKDARSGLIYESHYQLNAKNKMMRYLESNSDDNEFIIYVDGYVAGELSSEQYDEFKYMFHLHPKKVAEESSDELDNDYDDKYYSEHRYYDEVADDDNGFEDEFNEEF